MVAVLVQREADRFPIFYCCHLSGTHTIRSIDYLDAIAVLPWPHLHRHGYAYAGRSFASSSAREDPFLYREKPWECIGTAHPPRSAAVPNPKRSLGTQQAADLRGELAMRH